jgi:membrane protease YdiL (CAAX protease family)
MSDYTLSETIIKPIDIASGKGLGGIHKFAKSVPGVLLIVCLLTLLCYIETTIAIWAPYFFVYAILTIAIPLWVGVKKLKSDRVYRKTNWVLIATVIALAVAIDSGCFIIGYDSLLKYLGKFQPYYSISGATNLMVETVAQKNQLSTLVVMGIFGAITLLWAPYAEELFYRGYVYENLKRHIPLIAAWIISVFFFSIRHTIHFFYLWPELSVAGSVWAFSMIIFGSIVTWLYERTGKLWPSMLVHLCVNFVGIMVAL